MPKLLEAAEKALESVAVTVHVEISSTLIEAVFIADRHYDGPVCYDAGHRIVSVVPLPSQHITVLSNYS